MVDVPSTMRLESQPGSEDTELDEILRAVAHAPPRQPPPESVRSGTRWGAGGRYVIDRRLGRGGMGTVYSANDTLLGRAVALKVLDLGHSDDDDAIRESLLREARLAAPIEHERIARIYDVGEHEGALFVAMELVRGVTLRAWMDGRVATAEEVLSVTGQIAEGLSALHARGVFHRDLKPENVMLSDQGAVRLLDFGLARPMAHATGEGQDPVLAAAFADGASVTAFSGTPGYMAPEQWVGGTLDARVDVFALGVILYELVTGARPFVGDVLHVILQATLAAAPDFSAEAWQRVPPGLRDVTARMLARDPESRFTDGSAALLALREAGASQVTPIPVMPIVLPAPSTLREPASAVHEPFQAEIRASAAPPRTRPTWRVAAGIAALGALSAAALAIAFHHGRPPRPPAAEGMAWIDVGTITVGRDAKDLDRECAAIGPGCNRKWMAREVPSGRVTVAPFQLDVHEATNEEMAAVLNKLTATLKVVEDEDDHYPRYVRWTSDLERGASFLLDLHAEQGGIEYTADRTFRARAGRARLPVVQVTWDGAHLFCSMLGKSLPTEDEWEAAARGRANRPFPWGSAPLRCGEVVVPRDGLVSMPPSCPATVTVAPVGQALQDVTPEGIHDLGGNVSEWVDAVYVEGNRAARHDAGVADSPKIVRGGSWAFSFLARTSGRNRSIASTALANLGFRCAVH